MNNIILIGMPGSGKTTVGKILADKIGFGFLDADDYIEESEKRPLQDIIDDIGDDEFREIEEKRMLELKLNNHVIATGGSVILSEKAMKYLRSLGKITFLYAPLEIIKLRIQNGIGERGLVGLKSYSLEEIYNLRMPLYKKYADFMIDSSSEDLDLRARKVLDNMVGWLSGRKRQS